MFAEVDAPQFTWHIPFVVGGDPDCRMVGRHAFQSNVWGRECIVVNRLCVLEVAGALEQHVRISLPPSLVRFV